LTVRVGINGFGRMGRLGFRTGWETDELEFVHINETAADAACSAHLLKFDSVHGRWPNSVGADGDAVVVDGRRIGYSSRSTPSEVDWADKGIDVVVEASGKFRTPETLQPYFDQGVKKVVVAAPVPEPGLNIVMGVNDHLYNPEDHHLVTAASCTTNCLAPLVKVIHESVGIRHGTMTTIHDITNTQTVVDKGHKDLRRARASSMSLIPTSTGSAKAITQIFPELTGKLNGLAVRVPLLNASLTDFVFEAERATTVEEVNGLLRAAAEGPLRGILGYEELPLVSIDYKDDTRSCVVDAPSTMVVDETQVKILAWYDNEVGYANRLMELVRKVARMLAQ
jgi:glyceraldehyde 3-phosphate dehydrogenase